MSNGLLTGLYVKCDGVVSQAEYLLSDLGKVEVSNGSVNTFAGAAKGAVARFKISRVATSVVNSENATGTSGYVAFKISTVPLGSV